MTKQKLSADFQNDSATLIPLDQIQVGQRHRRDMGDIAALAASIAQLGLLQPIVITPAGQLIAGERQLLAAKRLGWTQIPVTVVDLDQIVRGEFAENAMRKDFTLSEAVAIKRALEPVEREAAKERQREHSGTAPGKHSGEILHSVNGRALDKIAKVIGQHRTTIAKAEAIVDAAEAEPERFGKLLADMDRTGKVNGAFAEYRRQCRRDEIAQAAAKAKLHPDRVALHHLPCNRLLEVVPERSVDWFFTDLPYPQEFLECFDELGAVAARAQARRIAAVPRRTLSPAGHHRATRPASRLPLDDRLSPARTVRENPIPPNQRLLEAGAVVRARQV